MARRCLPHGRAVHILSSSQGGLGIPTAKIKITKNVGLLQIRYSLWCWRRLLRVPWTARTSNQFPRGNQPWIFIGRTDAAAETPILWSSDGKSQLIGKKKTPDSGKDWRKEEKGATEDEMVGWHHQLNGYEFEQTLGDGGGQGSLAHCSPWGHKDSDTTERLNNKRHS